MPILTTKNNRTMQGYENYRKTDGCSKGCAVVIVNLFIIVAIVALIIYKCNEP